MRTVSLVLVMVLAKAIALAGHHVELNSWSPVAYFWHDAVVIVLAAALDYVVAQRPRLAWTAYAVTALYVAINIPVMLVLSTPLTWAMWRAAGGALSDSILYYLTWRNGVLFLVVVLAAGFAPVAFRRVRAQPFIVACVVVGALGPFAERRVETFGLGEERLDRSPHDLDPSRVLAAAGRLAARRI